MSVPSFKEMERDGWQARAAEYDDRVGRRTRTVATRLVDAVEIGPGRTLLDVCCGPGYSAGEAVARGASACGIDIAPNMIARAQAQFPGAQFTVGDAEALPYADASFDAVVSSFGMLHLPEPERAMAEALRVLRPGGFYAWTVWANGPEKAPMSALAQRAIAAYGTLDVPLPPAPPRELFASEAHAHATLARHGFVDIRSEEIALQFRAQSLAEVWEWYEQGTVRTAALLRLQTPEALARIKAAILNGAHAFEGPEGIVAPHGAVMYVAREPG